MYPYGGGAYGGYPGYYDPNQQSAFAGVPPIGGATTPGYDPITGMPSAVAPYPGQSAHGSAVAPYPGSSVAPYPGQSAPTSSYPGYSDPYASTYGGSAYGGSAYGSVAPYPNATGGTAADLMGSAGHHSPYGAPTGATASSTATAAGPPDAAALLFGSAGTPASGTSGSTGSGPAAATTAKPSSAVPTAAGAGAHSGSQWTPDSGSTGGSSWKPTSQAQYGAGSGAAGTHSQSQYQPKQQHPQQYQQASSWKPSGVGAASGSAPQGSTAATDAALAEAEKRHKAEVERLRAEAERLRAEKQSIQRERTELVGLKQEVARTRADAERELAERHKKLDEMRVKFEAERAKQQEEMRKAQEHLRKQHEQLARQQAEQMKRQREEEARLNALLSSQREEMEKERERLAQAAAQTAQQRAETEKQFHVLQKQQERLMVQRRELERQATVTDGEALRRRAELEEQMAAEQERLQAEQQRLQAERTQFLNQQAEQERWQREEMARQAEELQRQAALMRKHEQEERARLAEERHLAQEQIRQQREAVAREQELLRHQRAEAERKLQEDAAAKERAFAAQHQAVEQQKAELLAEQRRLEARMADQSAAAQRKVEEERRALVARQAEVQQQEQALRELYERNAQEKQAQTEALQRFEQQNQQLQRQHSVLGKQENLLHLQEKESQAVDMYEQGELEKKQRIAEAMVPLREAVAAAGVSRPESTPTQQAPSSKPELGVPASVLADGMWKNGVLYGRSRWAHVAAGDTELSTVSGEYLVILENSAADWWFVRSAHHGCEGYVQASYIQMLVPSMWSATLNLEEDVEGFRLANVVRLQRLLRKHLVLRRFWKAVDEYRVAGMVKDSPQRLHAMREVYTTELTYYTSLETLRTHYIMPLTDYAGQPQYGHTKEDVAVIFSNIDSLQKVSKESLSQMEQWIADSNYDGMAKLFLRLAPALKLYAEYVNNFDHAMQRLQELMKNPQFMNLLSACKQRSRSNLDLGSFLIQPVQRLPRYEILLREVIKHTPRSHPGYEELVQAKKAIKEGNQYINQRKRAQDGRTRLAELQSSVKRCPNITAPHRFHVRDAVLQVSSTRRNHTGSFHVFLLNDMLLACKEKSGRFMGLFSEKTLDFAFLLNLSEVEIRDAPDKNMFRLTSGVLENMDLVIYTFLIPSSVGSSGWIKDMHEFVKKASSPLPSGGVPACSKSAAF